MYKERLLRFKQEYPKLAATPCAASLFAPKDQTLCGIDPWDMDRISVNERLYLQDRMLREAIDNPWYFLTRIVRVRNPGTDETVPLHITPIMFHYVWAVTRSVTTVVSSPRQCGMSSLMYLLQKWAGLQRMLGQIIHIDRTEFAYLTMCTNFYEVHKYPGWWGHLFRQASAQPVVIYPGNNLGNCIERCRKVQPRFVMAMDATYIKHFDVIGPTILGRHDVWSSTQMWSDEHPLLVRSCAPAIIGTNGGDIRDNPSATYIYSLIQSGAFRDSVKDCYSMTDSTHLNYPVFASFQHADLGYNDRYVEELIARCNLTKRQADIDLRCKWFDGDKELPLP